MNRCTLLGFPLFFILFLVNFSAFGQGIITTFAGTDWVFQANGKPALNAPIGPLVSITVDQNGNPVFADPGNAVVLRLETAGTVTVLAGNGLQLYSGDGGASINAGLNSPFDAAYDANGNLFIADGLNNRVRMVTPGGAITTIAGNGAGTFNGDGGQAVNASLNQPYRIAVDPSGSVYVFDLIESRIRKITPTGTITTFAGNGQASYSGDNGPAALASLNQVAGMTFDAAGNLYLAEYGNNRVRKINPAGIITTIAGTGTAGYSGDGGPATQAMLYSPAGVAVDRANNIYISDVNNAVIRKINPQGIISTFAGNGQFGYSGDGGPALKASFNGTFGLALDSSGDLFIADRDNYRMRKISSSGIVSTVAGSGTFRYFPDGTRSSDAYLFWPYGMCADNQGNIYVADTYNNKIRVISSAGLVYTLAGNGNLEYTGDGGPGTSAGLAGPKGVALDTAGNLYIADTSNNIIRKLAPNGIITTVAGNVLTPGYGGDGGAATQAMLSKPEAVVFDASGNMYISDAGNNRIRKVTPAGAISTYAGNGQAKFAGDGGAANAASLNKPAGLAFDVTGRLLVADGGNSRVRVIAANGIISTLAGGGTQPENTGTPIPAVQTALGTPSGLAADNLGNIYISDSQTNVILKVSSAGMLTVIAGNGLAAFAGDGAPSPQASLDNPYGLALDNAGDLLIADAYNYRIRAVLAAPPLLQVSPASLSFSAKSSGMRTDPQNLTLTGSMAGLAYSLAITTTDGNNWLQANVNGGSLPATVQVLADPTGLAPGNYTGKVVVSLLSGPQSQTVSVSLTVAPPDSPLISLGSPALTFSFVQGGAPASQNLTVNNHGGGTLNFTAAAKPVSGGNWLSFSTSTGQTTPVQPASLTLQANPGSNPPGVYQAIASVSTTNGGTANLPVTMTISPANQQIVLSETGLKFTAVVQGGTPLPQTFNVSNGAQGNLTFTIKTVTLPGASGWLTATPSADMTSVSVSVNPNPAGSPPLAAGDYYGQIQVLSAGASNSPQLVSVILTVVPAANNPGPQVQTSGLIFSGAPFSDPGSQTIAIANLGSKPVNYSLARTTSDGHNWLLAAPASGMIAPNQPVQIVVQPDFSRLAAGTYHGQLSFSFDSGATRSVSILALVASTATPSFRLEPQTSSCSSQPLQVQWQSPPPNFAAVLGQPTALQVQVADGCGAKVANPTTASVTVTPSNQDPSVKLTHVGNGVWTGAWKPVNKATGAATINAIALNTIGLPPFETGQAGLSGTLSASVTPTVTAGGVVHAASAVSGAAIAPGSLITIYGSNLADSQGQASTLPLPQSQGGAQVLLGTTPLPILYTSTGQLNVQIPFSAPVDTQYQISVQRDNLVSLPEQLVVAQANPGVFTVNEQGTGQGVIFKSDGVTLAQTGTPATVGETVVIYCTGLGAVSPAVPDGTPAPAAPLSNTVNPVTVTIANLPAVISFSGLTPGYPGLYQINAVVPAGASGSAVQVVVMAGGQTSPPVTMAVQ